MIRRRDHTWEKGHAAHGAASSTYLACTDVCSVQGRIEHEAARRWRAEIDLAGIGIDHVRRLGLGRRPGGSLMEDARRDGVGRKVDVGDSRRRSDGHGHGRGYGCGRGCRCGCFSGRFSRPGAGVGDGQTRLVQRPFPHATATAVARPNDTFEVGSFAALAGGGDGAVDGGPGARSAAAHIMKLKYGAKWSCRDMRYERRQ